MRVRLLVLVSVVGLLAACSADPGPPSGSTSVATTTSTTSTTLPPVTTAPTTTSSTAAPVAAVPYFRFGDSGMYFLDGAGEVRLSSDLVATASHDGMGGVLFTSDAWQGGLQWTRPGAATVETLDYLSGWAAVLDGRPTAVVAKGTWSEECPETMYQVHLLDLTTGAERLIGCFGGEGGESSVSSGGGDLLVGTSWLAVGSNGTSSRIHFYDTKGGEVDHPMNPVPETCAPCELEVFLSTDGSRLAYRFRPDAKWSQDMDEWERIDALTHDEWWETSKDIPGKVTVLDLVRGEELFSMAVPAGERLTDFDGRYVVMESCERTPVGAGEFERVCISRIVDTEGEGADVPVEGRVRLATNICCTPPTVDVFPPLLRIWQPSEGEETGTRAYRFQGVADPNADVVAAGRYPVTVAADGTWAIVLILNPGRNVATITATDPAGNVTTVRRTVTYTPSPLVLRDDGLSVARFGDPADDVIAAVTGMLGAPDRVVVEPASDCYRSVAQTKFATWEAAGLRLVFTDWGGTALQPVATFLHFTDWEVIGPGLATGDGLGWGSTVGELRTVHPDVLLGINEYAPMFFIPAPSGWIMGGFDWPYEDFMTALQVALNEHGADLTITGDWNGGTTQALFDFMKAEGMDDAVGVLGALGLPPDDVHLGWIHAGAGPLCD